MQPMSSIGSVIWMHCCVPAMPIWCSSFCPWPRPPVCSVPWPMPCWSASPWHCPTILLRYRRGGGRIQRLPSQGPRPSPPARRCRRWSTCSSERPMPRGRQSRARWWRNFQTMASPGKRRAAQLLPSDLEAQSNLGNALYEYGLIYEAVEVLSRVVKLNPQHAEAYSNLGLALAQGGQLRESKAAFERALALRPDFEVAWNYISGVYNVMGLLDDGIAALRRAITLKPDYCTAFDNLLFTLNYHPDKSAEEIYRAYEEYEEKFGKPYRAEWRAHGNVPARGRRLKVGYVSPDFRQHSTSYFLEPLLAHHDSAAR